MRIIDEILEFISMVHSLMSERNSGIRNLLMKLRWSECTGTFSYSPYFSFDAACLKSPDAFHFESQPPVAESPRDTATARRACSLQVWPSKLIELRTRVQRGCPLFYYWFLVCQRTLDRVPSTYRLLDFEPSTRITLFECKFVPPNRFRIFPAM